MDQNPYKSPAIPSDAESVTNSAEAPPSTWPLAFAVFAGCVLGYARIAPLVEYGAEPSSPRWFWSGTIGIIVGGLSALTMILIWRRTRAIRYVKRDERQV